MHILRKDYMIFGRIMAYVGSEHGLVGHGVITKVFVTADVVAILTQATGGSMLVGSISISSSTCVFANIGHRTRVVAEARQASSSAAPFSLWDSRSRWLRLVSLCSLLWRLISRLEGAWATK